MLDLVCPAEYPRLKIYPNDPSRGNVCQNSESEFACPINCSQDSDYDPEDHCVQSGNTSLSCKITGNMSVFHLSMYKRDRYYTNLYIF